MQHCFEKWRNNIAFWNKPSPKSFDEPLYLKLQKIYQKYFGTEILKRYKLIRENSQERYIRY